MAEQGSTPGGRRGYAGTWPPQGAAPVGGLAPSRLALWPPLIETLRQWARAEAGAGRLLPWVPVAFGTGIAFYFAADHEPVLSVAAVTAIALCVAAFLLRRHKVFPVAVMIAAVAAGFAIATWKTARIAHGVLARPMFSVALTGFVETRDIRERTDRFVLRVVTMESARGTTKLERVRLSVKKGTAPDVGSFVELKARLLPPMSPLAARQLRFRPRHVLLRHRRLRLRDGRDQDRASRLMAAAGSCAIRRSCKACGTRSMHGSGPCWKATSARSRPRF